MAGQKESSERRKFPRWGMRGGWIAVILYSAGLLFSNYQLMGMVGGYGSKGLVAFAGWVLVGLSPIIGKLAFHVLAAFSVSWWRITASVLAGIMVMFIVAGAGVALLGPLHERYVPTMSPASSPSTPSTPTTSETPSSSTK